MARNSNRNTAPTRPIEHEDQPNDMSIIILAAGLGQKIKTQGARSLIRLSNGQTVIDRQIELLNLEFPDAEIIVVVGVESDKVMRRQKRRVRYVENELHNDTSVVRSIGMGLRATFNPHILLVYGDLVFNPYVIQGLTTKGSSVVADTKNNLSNFEVGMTVVNNHVTQFAYNLPTKWGQIAYITGRELEILKEFVFDRVQHKECGHEAFNAIINRGGSLRAVEHVDGKLVEIDVSKDIDRAYKV